MTSVSIKNFTRRSAAAHAVFTAIAGYVLPGWDISLVFAGAARARALNKKLRGKSYTPNVLSYALSSKSGEIIICLHEAGRQAPAYGMRERQFVLYLFIHGMLHLKGWAHGAKMERCEHMLAAKFAASSTRTSTTHATTHRNRNRHRHIPSEDRRHRRAR